MAGCLGGGVLTGFFVAFTAVVIAVLVFFPQMVGLGKGQTQIAITNALGELRRAPALKVATREVAVMVDASKPTELTVYPWIVPIGEPTKVELGRTTTQLVVPGNKVQYIVPLDAFKPGEEPDVREVERADGRLFVVVLPPPRVDESLVEVQSDPTKLSEAVAVTLSAPVRLRDAMIPTRPATSAAVPKPPSIAEKPTPSATTRPATRRSPRSAPPSSTPRAPRRPCSRSARRRAERSPR